MMQDNQKKIVVIGGGTGTSVVLSGLKKHPISLSAVITVADSGGSTGRLRDEFGFLPVGDMRQSLAALAEKEDEPWIQKLLLYRFNHGQGLEGHNLGNLILTALQDMTGSTPQAIEIAERIFNLEGSIYPVTEENVDLVVEYDDGSVIVGEHHLNRENGGGKHIKSVKLSKNAKLYSKAQKAIEEADLVVIGPGDMYASLAPNLIVDGMKEALHATHGKLVFIVNLMNSYVQTHNFKASDHVREIEKYIGRKIDYIIINEGDIPSDIKAHYEKEHEYQVIDNLDRATHRVVTDDLVGVTKVAQLPQDELKRSLLRHNEAKLTQILLSLLEEREK
jgi:uncharacterized cofD-like protein